MKYFLKIEVKKNRFFGISFVVKGYYVRRPAPLHAFPAVRGNFLKKMQFGPGMKKTCLQNIQFDFQQEMQNSSYLR